jgi:hypothetical protein
MVCLYSIHFVGLDIKFFALQIQLHTYVRNFSLITLDSELQLNNFVSGTLAQKPLLENSAIYTSTEKTTICTDTSGGAPQTGQIGTHSCT